MWSVLKSLFVLCLGPAARAIGDMSGVRGCPEFVRDDGSGAAHNHDGDPIPASKVTTVCVGGARCCYRKHCPAGVCTGFCLRRPNDPYVVTPLCPAWTDGTEAWYAQGVFSGSAPPVQATPPAQTSPPAQAAPPVQTSPPARAGRCPRLFTPKDVGGGPTDALYTSSQAPVKCTRTSRCCYYLHCPNGKCVFCLYSPIDGRPLNALCPAYDARANLYNVPGITRTFS